MITESDRPTATAPARYAVEIIGGQPYIPAWLLGERDAWSAVGDPLCEVVDDRPYIPDALLDHRDTSRVDGDPLCEVVDTASTPRRAICIALRSKAREIAAALNKAEK